MTASSDFIELDRRFRELKADAKPEDAALESYTREIFGRDHGLGWEELLPRRLVVVLGEPGSGKTWEFRQRAKTLSEAGQFGFFIRLDELANEPLARILDVQRHREFHYWRQGDGTAALFLDSVDEAKFHKIADFYTALDRLRSALGGNGLQRAKIFLSSRISEWHPETDLHELLFRFPSPERSRKSNAPGFKAPADQPGQSDVLVVQIEPLDVTRVQRFARERGIPNSDRFLEALDQNHAWELVRRPPDVIELATYWSEKGRLGSLSELIEYDVGSKLKPPSRDRSDPLSPERARDGAETLAAATIFCKQFCFKVPDQAFLGTNALDAQNCLPADWLKNESQALLHRPLFDGASYGRIRFHHRRVAEYLAGKWLARRMDQGCPSTELGELLFEFNNGQPVIRLTLEPVTAWLCCGNERWNDEVRRWVLKSAPEIHLQCGDPGCLPVDYKRDVLYALVQLHGGKRFARIGSTADSLKRFAGPELAGTISTIICDRSIGIDVRAEMIQTVRYGRLEGCLGSLLTVIANPEEPDDLKCYAAGAIRDMGDENSRKRLAEIAEQMPRLSNQLSSRICEALYPNTIDPKQLVAMLRKTESQHRSSIGLPFYLRSHLQKVATPKASGGLLAELLALAQCPPYRVNDENAPISAQFDWVGEVIPVVLLVLLDQAALGAREVELAAAALQFLGLLREAVRDFRDDELQKLNAATIPNPAVRQAYFWRLVDAWRATQRREPTRFFQIFDHYETVRQTPEDLEWLIEDIQRRPQVKDRELALRFAVDLLGDSGAKCRTLMRISRSVKDPALKIIFRKSTANWLWIWVQRIWYRRHGHKFLWGWWWKQRFNHITQFCNWLREQWSLHRHCNRLASGEFTDWLADLVREAEHPIDPSRWAPGNWNGLRKKRGRRITHAVKGGCKRAWRQFRPLLPHEKTEPSKTDVRVIVGLAGLQAGVIDEDLEFSELSEDEARLAARYAISELNGFPAWFTDLARVHQKAIQHVLCDCVQGEWSFAADRQEVHEVMYHLVWHADDLVPLVQDFVLELLRAGDPSNRLIMEVGLTMLLKQKQPPALALAEIAESRVKSSSLDEHGFALWLAVWLQTDAQSALKVMQDEIPRRRNAGDIMIKLCAILNSHHPERSPVMANPSYINPASLRSLIPLVFKYVKPSEDIDRSGTGVFTPQARDHAQRFRSGLLERLTKSEKPEATAILRDLAGEPALLGCRAWILHEIEEREHAQADLRPWKSEDIRSFATEHEIQPRTDSDLFRITRKRLGEIKLDVEQSDNSLRDELRLGDLESHLRRWVARKLNERSRKRYTVPQEEEIDQRERPDLRVENPNTDPVSIEVKWADNWSLSEVLERLENQLIGQYLRAHNSRFGVYLLGMIGKKQNWKDPDSGENLSFDRVVQIVSAQAATLVAARTDVKEIAVISIDFREPSRAK